MENQSVRTTSMVPNVFSIIALVVSGIALVCVLLLLIISKSGTEPDREEVLRRLQTALH